MMDLPLEDGLEVLLHLAPGHLHPDAERERRARLYLVDLPGYGYARCSKSERDKWAKLIARYLQNNSWLIGVVALLDSRLPPQVMDMELIGYITSLGVDVIPVMTKADKCKQNARHTNQAAWQRLLHGEKPPLLVSSHSGMNIDKLWQLFVQRLPHPPA